MVMAWLLFFLRLPDVLGWSWASGPSKTRRNTYHIPASDAVTVLRKQESSVEKAVKRDTK